MIVGQPEAIDALLSIEKQNILVGSGMREKPETMYLMGLRGMGKDTISDGYAKSQHDGRWRDHIFEMPLAKSLSSLLKFMARLQVILALRTCQNSLKYCHHAFGGRYQIKYADGGMASKPNTWLKTKRGDLA